MKKIWESNGEEAKLAEQKHKEMNELIGLNNIQIEEWPILYIDNWCAEHIKILHKENPNTEWLAYCKVEPQGNWVFLMTDMVFPWQRTTGWDVETTQEWMEWLNKELIARWENWTEWNCVLHSHHHMGCFWSWTDDRARLSLNDGRPLARAVVTAYDGDTINYKGCLNFYKPYNIEIDALVKNLECESIVDKYGEYLEKVAESEASFYEFLLQENKDYIDSITNKPSYNTILDYLDLDITAELEKNYEDLKDKIGNPELVEYMKQLENLANDLAVKEVSKIWNYQDMLVEYWAFCEWSDNLLAQLERNKTKTVATVIEKPIMWMWITSQVGLPSNRDFEEPVYYFTTPDFDEMEIRYKLGIDSNIPMKVWPNREWQAWSEFCWQFIYVEDRADEMWY